MSFKNRLSHMPEFFFFFWGGGNVLKDQYLWGREGSKIGQRTEIQY